MNPTNNDCWVIRTDNNDPLKQVTFENDNLKIKTPAYRRVGRPRKQWIIKQMSFYGP